ncbi:RIMS-binding protein 2 isoform X4 [Gorilla gorilla gorilla]|uniref:RIMS-binding protein 2 isoform X4 n=1 Tax=Gorilla gorilla gorilla TaxID=9595 RepID=UPI002445E872|nr:RIMS-binding protein 2 isoform X7 [Gorilla gorilla gorilla]XP_030856683.2 RIMS-binding protein 2 isoform X7 [Gorilla gorilla gorilla]XP_055213598.1 RIMS-binding protein 2 isoform X7 [Gorilla gorilla gorilla]XP_055213599.1 RIMS-binding protein 2 isoform X7 [Gorilla gorilla gorilla]XP_055213600.1 RIMS-binding protein 2 isoform X7 [Gorilla gorilla gorilla]
MREAAERRQQLELEHEQALAVLSAKQQEIDLLQKAQVEAKKEHEGAVRLLESKVRELEEKCRTQSEQFNLLSRDLEKFRQHAGKIDLLGGSAVAPLDISTAPSKPFPQFMNGLATSLGKGQESAIGGSSAIGEYIRPLPQPGDRPEPLSAKPTFLSRSGSTRCRSESDMENERNSNTSKQRYSGKVHLCVARYSYNPFDGPNENPEAELPLTAGKYLYVYGDMDEDGFYEGELLDGQRGLVPSNFVDFVQDNESRLASTLGNEQDQNFINHSGIGLEGEHILDLHSPTHIDAGITDNSAGTLDVNIDDIGEDIVPYPRKITLIKQLAKSVIVGWEPPAVPPGWGTVSSYNVLVDKETRMNLTLGSRTKALIEKLNMAACTYRISVQCVTSRGSSDELQCTLLVGKDVVVAPSHLRVDNITQISAQLSWLPTNSNYSHVIFLNEEEFDIVKAARYKYQFFNLRPNMAYKVKVLAKPHQMPWQLPLEQREKKEAFVEFSTLPAGPPAPPQDVTVQAGVTPATIRVSWRPPVLTPTGLSNGANVTGYGVYAKGQRVAEVIFPTADSTAVELVRLRSLEAKGVTVRTLSAQGESVDSAVAAVPPELLVPPTPHPRPAPQSKPLASSGVPETKDEHLGPHARMDEAWEQSRAPGPVHGHMLEPPVGPGRRSPSPSRILPQPQGTPVSTTVAKAMAREAAQRVAESSRLEKRSVFLERSSTGQYAASDEEDAYDSPDFKRRGASVDDFLKGSELGKQPHCCHGDEYHTESSRGSDLSDIMEEDEEELYSEMQLEDGGRRRPSGTSHNALKILGNPASAGRVDHMGRRFPRGSAGPQRSRPVTVPSIDDYGRDRLSPDFYEESETDPGAEELPARIFVALFDYDPLTMSPNPDAAEEELPFKEGQIIKVYGDKDADGFYRGETCARLGLIPCNMVSEIQADDEEMMDQLLRQGFLPLNTPVEKIERSRRSGRHHSVSTRRMVALYDYDPRESSPNVDVEAELTFCTGDIITVFGEIDEDGFYYGELNGQKGLVPSNFLEEVPDDVEVYLSDAPSHYSQDTPMRSKTKRVPPEGSGTARRAPSPTVHLHSGSPTSSMGSGSPGRGREMSSKKKKGLLSKGKKLLKKLGAVK